MYSKGQGGKEGRRKSENERGGREVENEGGEEGGRDRAW